MEYKDEKLLVNELIKHFPNLQNVEIPTQDFEKNQQYSNLSLLKINEFNFEELSKYKDFSKSFFDTLKKNEVQLVQISKQRNQMLNLLKVNFIDTNDIEKKITSMDSLYLFGDKEIILDLFMRYYSSTKNSEKQKIKKMIKEKIELLSSKVYDDNILQLHSLKQDLNIVTQFKQNYVEKKNKSLKKNMLILYGLTVVSIILISIGIWLITT